MRGGGGESAAISANSFTYYPCAQIYVIKWVVISELSMDTPSGDLQNISFR